MRAAGAPGRFRLAQVFGHERIWSNEANIKWRPGRERIEELCGWSENRDLPWPKLLDFWGLPNLQVINRDAHAAKCAIEARHRRVARSLETELT